MKRKPILSAEEIARLLKPIYDRTLKEETPERFKQTLANLK